jgi:hypothetical protein
MFLLYYSVGCNICRTCFYEYYSNDYRALHHAVVYGVTTSKSWAAEMEGQKEFLAQRRLRTRGRVERLPTHGRPPLRPKSDLDLDLGLRALIWAYGVELYAVVCREREDAVVQAGPGARGEPRLHPCPSGGGR